MTTTTMMMMLPTLSPASGQGSPLLSPMPPAAAGARSPGRRLRRARGSAWHTAMQLHCSFSDTTTRSCRRAGGPRPPGATGAARGLAGGRAGGNRTWRPSTGFQDVGRAPEAARSSIPDPSKCSAGVTTHLAKPKFAIPEDLSDNGNGCRRRWHGCFGCLVFHGVSPVWPLGSKMNSMRMQWAETAPVGRSSPSLQICTRGRSSPYHQRAWGRYRRLSAPT